MRKSDFEAAYRGREAEESGDRADCGGENERQRTAPSSKVNSKSGSVVAPQPDEGGRVILAARNRIEVQNFRP